MHWISLQLGNTLTMKVNTDWKLLLFSIFYGPEKTIRLAKKKITKIEEKLNETVKY